MKIVINITLLIFICCARKKDKEGLGIPDLRDLNLCMLASWVQRYYEGGDKLWKAIVDNKYDLNSPNIFCCNERKGSPFLKGIMWAAQAAKMGYRWKIGNGKKIRFWEDQWSGTCSLAIQFWKLYAIVSEQGRTVEEAWDGLNFKFTFRRTVNREVMKLWEEVKQIASSIQLKDEEDSIIWQFNSSGKYSVQSLYAVLNDRGLRQVYTPVMWKIHVPSRIHVFLWLMANNKTLTRDNLAIRREVNDKTCLFCSENESVKHLFYECCVARNLWGVVAEIIELPLVRDFESMAKWWIRGKKYAVVNVIYAAVLWTIWKLRSILCFQEVCWEAMRRLMLSCARLLRNWAF
jgi:hypothetical protein